MTSTMPMLSRDSQDTFTSEYHAFDQEFYNCLRQDLAKELDFPSDADLTNIRHLELFGSSWETDPYKQLLMRCLDHTLPKSPDYDIRTKDDMDFEYLVNFPKNPPPSPALSSISTSISSQDQYMCCLEDEIDNLSLSEQETISDSGDEEFLLHDEDVEGVTPGQEDYTGRPKRPTRHQREESTGLLATVMAGDGSITWHFREL